MNFDFDSISLWISILSFFMSLFVLINNLWKERFNIKLTQRFHGDQSGFLLSYDGVNASESRKSGKPKMEHVLLLRVVISNNSSNPVTIISFFFEKPFYSDFSNHSHTEPFYQITNENGSIVTFGFPDAPLDYLQPSFSLAPYQAVEGYLSFWITDPKLLKTGERLTMGILSSRGTARKKIIVPTIYEANFNKMHQKFNPINYQ